MYFVCTIDIALAMKSNNCNCTLNSLKIALLDGYEPATWTIRNVDRSQKHDSSLRGRLILVLFKTKSTEQQPQNNSMSSIGCTLVNMIEF